MASDVPRPPATSHAGAAVDAPLADRPRLRLDLGDAIHDGWLAFCRAPRLFAAFALLVNLLQLALQPLMAGIGSRSAPSGDPRAWLLFALALALMLLVNLWAQPAMVRGAWLALDGVRPTLGQLLRPEARVSLRLLRAWLRLTALVGLPLLAALALFGVPLLLLWEPALQRALGDDAVRLLALSLMALLLLSLALALVAVVYLTVNQAFLVQIVLIEARAGAAAVRRGRQLVDPQWPLVLLLVLVTGILSGLGLLACVVGSFVAWPAVVCIGTAAYRQLRAAEAAQAEGSSGAAALSRADRR